MGTSVQAKFFGLRTFAGAATNPTGNAVVITGGVGSTALQYGGMKFYGCNFVNSPPPGATKQAGALVNIKQYAASLIQTAMFHGCLFTARDNTTDWFYVEVGIAGAVQVSDADFKGTVTTNKWKDLSGLLEFARCTGLGVPTAGEVDASGEITLTGIAQDVPGAGVTLVTPKGKLLVTATFDFSVVIASEILGGALNVDGAGVSREAYTAGQLQRQATSQTWMVSLDSGSHTIKLQARRVSGSAAGHTVNSPHTGFTYQFISDNGA